MGMGQRVVPSPFLTKTYELVEDATTNDVVSWNQSGTAFVVWKTADLAKDLLPNYFKHNNFSSFVRQLNTYGFRKVVPDKWEFANENFRRGQKELLTKIRRRKNVTSSPAGKPTAPSVSGDDLGSSSTSSPDSKSPASVEAPAAARFADLSDENEKLRKDNESLSSELVQTKKQCEDLVAFLTQCLKVGPDQINRIMRQGSCGPAGDGSAAAAVEIGRTADGEADDDDKEGEDLKLFGVWLKGEKKKRGRDEKMDFYGVQRKDIKTVDFHAPWMRISPSSGESNKVCN